MAALLALILSLAVVGVGRPDTTLVEEFSFGSFVDATRLLVTADGSVLVTDAGQHRLFVFATPRDAPRSVGGYGWLPGSFDIPTGVATDGVNIYVSDYGNHRVQRFDRTLNYISTLLTRDTSDAMLRFGYPLGVAMSGFGDLLILDGENHRVLKFTAGSRFDPMFASAGINRGILSALVKVCVTPSGTVIVGEKGVLHVLDLFGNELHAVRDSSLSDLRGLDADDRSLVAVTESGLLWMSSDGSNLRQIPAAAILGERPVGRIHDVALRGERVYVLTPDRILVFRTTSN